MTYITLAGMGMPGNAVSSGRGPTMLNSDLRFVELSSAPPLATAEPPVAPAGALPPTQSGTLAAACKHCCIRQ